jgi:hypothetical protein
MSAGTIDAGVLVAGSVKAAHLASKSITTDKLVVSSTDNLVVEADFGNGGTSWGVLNANKAINATAGRGSLPALRVTGSIALQTINNLVNRVTVGTEDRFRGSMYVKSSSAAASGVVKLRMNAFTTATTSTPVTIATSQALTAGQYTLVEGYSPALPANTIAVEFFIEVQNAATGTTLDIDYVSVTRAADGKLVIDGAMDAKTITGALFQTDNSPIDSPLSRGIKLNSAGLKAYDPFGLMTFGIDALTGVVSSVGTFSTESTEVNYMGGTSTAKAVFGILNNESFDNIPGITFNWGTGTEPNQRIAALYNAGTTTTLTSRLTQTVVYDQSVTSLNVSDTEGFLESVGPQANASDWQDRAIIRTSAFGYDSANASMQVNLSQENTAENSREMSISLGEFPGYSDGRIRMYHDKNVGGTRIKSFDFIAEPSGRFQMVGYKDYSYTIGARILHDHTDNSLYLTSAGKVVTGAPQIVFTPSTNPNGDQVVIDNTGINLNGTVKVNGVSPILGGAAVQVLTTSGTMPAATSPVPQIGTLTTDSTRSTSTTLVSGNSGQINISEAGVYDIGFQFVAPGPMSTRSFIDITNGANGQAYARYSIAVNEDQGVATATGLKLAAGDVVKFYVYMGRAAGAYSAIVRVTKVAAPTPDEAWITSSQAVEGPLSINGYDYSSGTAKMPFIILKKVGNQTLSAANTFYDLAWDGADVYNYQMTHSSTVNNHQITIQKAGIYEINYKIGINTTTGHVSGSIGINGVSQGTWVQRVGNNSGQFEKAQLVQTGAFAVGDVITIQAATGTAGAAADGVCTASIRMIVPT